MKTIKEVICHCSLSTHYIWGITVFMARTLPHSLLSSLPCLPPPHPHMDATSLHGDPWRDQWLWRQRLGLGDCRNNIGLHCVTIPNHPEYCLYRNETWWSSWDAINVFLWFKWTLLGDSQHWEQQINQVHLEITVGSVRWELQSQKTYNVLKWSLPAFLLELSVMMEMLEMHSVQSNCH